MNQEQTQNVFIGLLAAGLILLGGGMYLISQQVKSVATSVKGIQAVVTAPVAVAPVTNQDLPTGDNDRGIMVVDDGKVLATKALSTKAGKIVFSWNCYGETPKVNLPTGDNDSSAGIECVGDQALFAVFPNGGSTMIDTATTDDVKKMLMFGEVEVSASDSNVVSIQYAPNSCFWTPDLCTNPVSFNYSLDLTTKEITKLK